MDKLPSDLCDDRGKHVGWGVLVHGLCESDEDRRDAQLMVRKILHDMCVEAQYAELVHAHDTRKELHYENLVVEGEAFVVTVEDVI